MWIHLSCHRVQWSRMIFFLLGFSPEFDNSSPFGFKISENIYKPENVQPCSWWWGTKASNLLSLQPWQAVAGIPLFQIFTATWWKINLPHGKERKHQRSVNKSAWQILIQYLNAAEAHKIDSLPLMSKRNHVLCWIFFFLYFATFSVCGSGENKSFKFTKLHHYRRCRFHKTVCGQECLFLINERYEPSIYSPHPGLGRWTPVFTKDVQTSFYPATSCSSSGGTLRCSQWNMPGTSPQEASRSDGRATSTGSSECGEAVLLRAFFGWPSFLPYLWGSSFHVFIRTEDGSWRQWRSATDPQKP